MNNINLLHGDCLEQMKTLPDNSVDSIVTDPPYGMSFMSKKWDYDVPSVEVWKEAMRTARTISADNAETAARQFRRIRKSLEEKGKIDVSVTGVLPVRTGADK